MSRRFVVGDIHGRFVALREVLQKSGFDYDNDRLILLGDLVDGGYDAYQVVEELLKIKNVVFCKGNHDEWFLSHIKSGFQGEIWLSQGGKNTVRSYRGKVEIDEHVSGGIPVITQDCLIPVTHQEFFNRAVPFHVELSKPFEELHDCVQGRGKIIGLEFSHFIPRCVYCHEIVALPEMWLFVHGGFDARHGKTVFDASFQELTWDRDLIEWCREGNAVPHFAKVFVGHTTTQMYGEDVPIRFGNLLMLDTGAGWNGKLTLMDIDTGKYWQSKTQVPAVRDSHD